MHGGGEVSEEAVQAGTQHVWPAEGGQASLSKQVPGWPAGSLQVAP